jgi:hypothetical protein
VSDTGDPDDQLTPWSPGSFPRVGKMRYRWDRRHTGGAVLAATIELRNHGNQQRRRFRHSSFTASARQDTFLTSSRS